MKTTTATRLRELRKAKKVSQLDVSNYLGIERASYSAYELGVSRPVRYIDKLAVYFGVSTDYILGMSDIPHPPKEILGEAEQRLINGYWEMNEQGKSALLMYLDFLLSQQANTKKDASVS